MNSIPESVPLPEEQGSRPFTVEEICSKIQEAKQEGSAQKVRQFVETAVIYGPEVLRQVLKKLGINLKPGTSTTADQLTKMIIEQRKVQFAIDPSQIKPKKYL